MNSVSTPQERQAQSSAGLRERLFATLDAVIEGKVKKDEVEAVCYLSQEILKSAKVDLEFEDKALQKIELQHRLEMERRNTVELLNNTIIEIDDENR
jgi:hypothetical protein